MALTATLHTPELAAGLTHSAAYIKVGTPVPTGDPSAPKSKVNVQIWVDAAARDGNNPSNTVDMFTAEMSETDTAAYLSETELKKVGNSPLSQAYAWVKQQTSLNGYDFTSASDA